ncbi:enolase [Candidatus Micrarchaeota archaeon]|nr:enolase [Candidatus Micrarchaeota archaeon]
MPNRIRTLKARRILNSRGDYTIETTIQTANGFFAGSAPKGGSKGNLEAKELPAITAVRKVNLRIAPHLVKRALPHQSKLDARLLELDGTRYKSRLGGNSLLSVSIAGCKANAAAKNKKLYQYIAQLADNKKLVLPVPFLNILNGGKHAGMKNDIQEAMIVPKKFKSFSAALGAGTAVFHALRKILHQKWGASATLVGNEGGFVPQKAKTIEQRLELLENAVEQAGFKKKVFFAIDSAATQFYSAKKKQYVLGKKKFSKVKLVEYYARLAKSFPLVSIEDGLAENDWNGWEALTQKMGKKLQIVGDDLLVSNPAYIRMAAQKKACNYLLLKPNQIGTVSESIEASQLALKSKWMVMVSHRSGETNDSFIADLAVGLGVGQCKFGAPDRGERIAKYNRLLQIESELGKKARFGI